MITLHGRRYTWNHDWHGDLIGVRENYGVRVGDIHGFVVGIWPYKHEEWDGPSYLIQVTTKDVGWKDMALDGGEHRYIFGYHHDTEFLQGE